MDNEDVNDSYIARNLKKLENDCASARKGLSDMNAKWSKHLATCSERVCDHEQYSRRDSLLLHMDLKKNAPT